MELDEMLDTIRERIRAMKPWGPSLKIHVPLTKRGVYVARVSNDLHGGMNEPHTDDTIWEGRGETLMLAVEDLLAKSAPREPVGA
jgi:hypothetical protein